ncbi:MAG TPA: GDSL-type esterase/lipase family protein [Candidatus Saccharimonadales bacterium]|nr:GDSL-type esterase/lipase family protein [Candidatus Saccharimonadales bacterium]
MRVLVFGDSITQGFWDTEGGWVNRIRKHYDSLQVQDLQGRDDPVIFNLGISADTSEMVLHRIENETKVRQGISRELPAVVVQIGINDSLSESGKIWVPIENYTKNLEAIISKVKPISSKIIFIGFNPVDDAKTNPVAWGDFNYQSNTIKKYEDAMSVVAQQNIIPFMPIFDKFKTEIDAGKDFLPDGLHPNNAGHEFIASLILPELDALLT